MCSYIAAPTSPVLFKNRYYHLRLVSRSTLGKQLPGKQLLLRCYCLIWFVLIYNKNIFTAEVNVGSSSVSSTQRHAHPRANHREVGSKSRAATPRSKEWQSWLYSSEIREGFSFSNGYARRTSREPITSWSITGAVLTSLSWSSLRVDRWCCRQSITPHRTHTRSSHIERSSFYTWSDHRRDGLWSPTCRPRISIRTTWIAARTCSPCAAIRSSLSGYTSRTRRSPTRLVFAIDLHNISYTVRNDFCNDSYTVFAPSKRECIQLALFFWQQVQQKAHLWSNSPYKHFLIRFNYTKLYSFNYPKII